MEKNIPVVQHVYSTDLVRELWGQCKKKKAYKKNNCSLIIIEVKVWNNPDIDLVISPSPKVKVKFNVKLKSFRGSEWIIQCRFFLLYEGFKCAAQHCSDSQWTKPLKKKIDPQCGSA